MKIKCPDCNGRGTVPCPINSLGDMYGWRNKCELCDGTGRINTGYKYKRKRKQRTKRSHHENNKS